MEYFTNKWTFHKQGIMCARRLKWKFDHFILFTMNKKQDEADLCSATKFSWIEIFEQTVFEAWL